ncbi:hypothetical protein BC360_10360 [Ensifer sp. LC163]|nr:hypothetical protein BC360_10360 [Ensifer sp. LC163]
MRATVQLLNWKIALSIGLVCMGGYQRPRTEIGRRLMQAIFVLEASQSTKTVRLGLDLRISVALIGLLLSRLF